MEDQQILRQLHISLQFCQTIISKISGIFSFEDELNQLPAIEKQVIEQGPRQENIKQTETDHNNNPSSDHYDIRKGLSDCVSAFEAFFVKFSTSLYDSIARAVEPHLRDVVWLVWEELCAILLTFRKTLRHKDKVVLLPSHELSVITPTPTHRENGRGLWVLCKLLILTSLTAYEF